MTDFTCLFWTDFPDSLRFSKNNVASLSQWNGGNDSLVVVLLILRHRLQLLFLVTQLKSYVCSTFSGISPVSFLVHEAMATNSVTAWLLLSLGSTPNFTQGSHGHWPSNPCLVSFCMTHLLLWCVSITIFPKLLCSNPGISNGKIIPTFTHPNAFFSILTVIHGGLLDSKDHDDVCTHGVEILLYLKTLSYKYYLDFFYTSLWVIQSHCLPCACITAFTCNFTHPTNTARYRLHFNLSKQELWSNWPQLLALTWVNNYIILINVGVSHTSSLDQS